MSKAQKKKGYKATKLFKGIVSDKMLSNKQYTAMVEGKRDELNGLTEKRLNYLLVNNLIDEV